MSRIALLAGDFALLVTVGIEAALGMHLAHEFVPNVVASTIAGMIAGMITSMATAFIVRPLLGSIETTVPTMIGGMVGGVAVCLVMLAAGTISAAIAMVLGGATGTLLFLVFAAFAAACRHRFDRQEWRG
jgi:hypothetical protein